MQLNKELRERTGAPVTDVKSALQAAAWDLGEGVGAGMADQGCGMVAQERGALPTPTPLPAACRLHTHTHTSHCCCRRRHD